MSDARLLLAVAAIWVEAQGLHNSTTADWSSGLEHAGKQVSLGDSGKGRGCLPLTSPSLF